MRFGASNTEKFQNQALHRKSVIPQTLLQKPLAPDQIPRLNDEEKRQYNIQKGKYDMNMRLLEKKKLTNDLPS